MPSSKKRKRLSQEEAELSRPAKQLRRNESNEEEGEEEEEEELEFAAFDGDSDDGDDDNNPVDEELDDSADLEEEEDDGEPSAPDDRFTATFDEINPEYLTSAEPSGADSTIRQNYFRLQTDALLAETKFTNQNLLKIGSAIETLFNNINQMFSELPEVIQVSLKQSETSPKKNKKQKQKQKQQEESILTAERLRAALHYYGRVQGGFSDGNEEDDSECLTTFEFRKPRSMAVVGSFAMSSAAKYDPNLDISIELPFGYIKQKDIREFRYHQKRLLYLMALTELFEKNSERVFNSLVKMNLTSFTRDCYGWLKPVLTVTIIDKDHPLCGFNIRFLPATVLTAFKTNRTLPDKTNLTLVDAHIAHNDQLVRFYHAYYNNTVAQDAFMLKHAKFVARSLAGIRESTDDFPRPHPRYADALLLLKIWLAKRQSIIYGANAQGGGRLSGFFVQMLLAHLVASGRVTRDMPLAFIFKFVLQFIVNRTDELKNSKSIFVHLNGQATSQLSAEEQAVWTNCYEVVFLDPEAQVNITAHLTMDDWLNIVEEARESLKLLETDKALDPFAAVFGLDLPSDLMAPQGVSAISNYDLCLNVAYEPSPGTTSRNMIYTKLLYYRYIHTMMRTALSARYTMIVPLPIGRDVDGNYVTCPSCPISSVQQSPLQLHRISFNSIVFGLRANPSTWKRLLDAGPPSQLEMTDELKQFIEFWGPKAHQRQFKDGRLQYCVLWEAPEHSRHLITLDIAQYVLQRHCNIDPSNVTLIGEQLDLAVHNLIPPAKNLRIKTINAGISASLQNKVKEESEKCLVNLHESTQNIESAWNILREYILELGAPMIRKPGTKPAPDELPLAIRNLRLVHSSARRTMAVAPTPLSELMSAEGRDGSVIHPAKAIRVRKSENYGPTFSEPLRAVLQFEGAGAWPEDVEAIANVKRAFFLKIASGLKDRHQIQSIVTKSFMDVFFAGYVFRIDIFHPREIFLVEKTEPKRAIRMQFEYEERVRLTSTLKAIHDANPAFGPAAALVKRWLSAHLVPVVDHFEVDDETSEQSCSVSATPKFHYVPEIVADILTAAVFVSSAPRALGQSPPRHYLSAFLRVLRLLATYDFQKSPLIVDLNDSLTNAMYTKIQKEFDSADETKKPPLYIVYSSNVEVLDMEGDDKKKSVYLHLNIGQHAPSSTLVARIRKLAEQTYSYLVRNLAANPQEEKSAPLANSLREACMKVFIPSYSGFDVVVRLKSSAVTRWHQNVRHLVSLASVSRERWQESANDAIEKLRALWLEQRKLLGVVDDEDQSAQGNRKNLKKRTEALVKVVDFDPALKATEYLGRLLPHMAHIFFDAYGGDRIAISWKEGVMSVKQNLRPTNMRHSMIKRLTVAEGKTKLVVVPNIQDILVDIQAILGSDIIEQIVLAQSYTF